MALPRGYLRISSQVSRYGGSVMSVSTKFQTIFKTALVAGLFLAVPLWGQEFRGTITGTVTDPSGAAVPQVQIEARNVDTSAIVTARTNADGVYSIPFL